MKTAQKFEVRGWWFLLFCQGPVILDLFLPYPLVLLPPTLRAQALPRRVAIVATSLFAKQVRLVHVYPPSLCPLTHDAGRPTEDIFFLLTSLKERERVPTAL